MSGNLYDVLQVDRNATLEEIKLAFKRRALQVHPDKGKVKISCGQGMHYVFLFDLYRVSVSDVLLCQAMFSPQVVLRRPSIWSAKHWRHWRTQRPARGMTAAWPAKQCAKHGNGEHAALRLPKRKVQRHRRPTAARNPEGSQVLSQRHQISRSQKEPKCWWKPVIYWSSCLEVCGMMSLPTSSLKSSGWFWRNGW